MRVPSSHQFSPTVGEPVVVTASRRTEQTADRSPASGVDRRRFLVGAAGTLPVAISGCLGFGGGDDGDGSSSDDSDDGSSDDSDDGGSDDSGDNGDESSARSQLEQYIDYEYWFEPSGIGAVFKMNVENVTGEQLGFLVTPRVYVEDEEMGADSDGEQLEPGRSTQVTLNIFTVGDNEMEDVTRYVFDISVYRGSETLVDVEEEREDFHERFEAE
jgi:hypothetical protein